MRAEVICLGRRLWAEAQWLDEGCDIGVYGGDQSHVGAVSLGAPDGTVRTLTRSGHRDNAVSERWALALTAAWHCPVCVRCGIHFDHFTKEKLPHIESACEQLLCKLITMSEREANL